MKNPLFRSSYRYPNGIREWIVPGAPHSVKLIPSDQSFWGVPTLKWPHKDEKGDWFLRSVRIDWNRSISKAEIRKILASLA